ncbi:RNA methyltransferase [Lysobacter brunescens]|uniref:tRNA (cytidine/uridine-2'-O-)-methyltransferase TrmJ n=1 Tax=Lysobacter brunescens TaxID=262323 RepID=A0ABW2YCI8_9GAMM
MTSDPTSPESSTFPSSLDRVRIVLVGTQHPGNIGSAARAMKTMGLSRLVLVAPERFPHPEAVALAAGAADLLDSASRFETLAEAVADCRLVLGCTARSRRIALEELSPRVGAARALDTADGGADVAVVFGRERTGLENDELQLCHAAVHIPANPDYSSLNLAAAVQVLAYELRIGSLQASSDPVDASIAVRRQDERPEVRSEPPATHGELEGFFSQLADTLDAIDFHKGRTPAAAIRKFRRLFLRAGLDAREVRLLRGMLADAQRMADIAHGRLPAPRKTAD